MLFLVASIKNPARSTTNSELMIEEKIKELKLTYYRRDNLFFVSFSGTTTELSEKVGFGNDEKIGFGVVIRVVHYAGYSLKEMWEWMANYE